MTSKLPIEDPEGKAPNTPRKIEDTYRGEEHTEPSYIRGSGETMLDVVDIVAEDYRRSC